MENAFLCIFANNACHTLTNIIFAVTLLDMSRSAFDNTNGENDVSLLP